MTYPEHQTTPGVQRATYPRPAPAGSDNGEDGLATGPTSTHYQRMTPGNGKDAGTAPGRLEISGTGVTRNPGSEPSTRNTTGGKLRRS